MTKLFLLKHDFTDINSDKEGTKYYCPQCAMIEGIIKYYPQLEELVEIHRVDFKRPRQQIIDLIGTENQGCPVLIIENSNKNSVFKSYFTPFGDKLFVNRTELIARYFAEKAGIGKMH